VQKLSVGNCIIISGSEFSDYLITPGPCTMGSGECLVYTGCNPKGLNI
jgi:hypothetical protein